MDTWSGIDEEMVSYKEEDIGDIYMCVWNGQEGCALKEGERKGRYKGKKREGKEVDLTKQNYVSSFLQMWGPLLWGLRYKGRFY